MLSLNFDEEIVLENDRTLLRPLKHSDFDILVQFSFAEPDIWKYSLVQPNTPKNMKKYIEDAINDRESKKCFPFIIFDKLEHKYAGSSRFYNIEQANKVLSIGYTWYGQAFQGTGLNKNCKYLMLKYAFEVLGIKRVEFRADNDNARSIAAMKRIGAIPDGILRSDSIKADGQRRDSIVLSILEQEWQETIKTKILS